MKVKIGDYEYPVIIVRKRIKNMYLRTSANNEILITCNNRFSLKDIVSFIDSKADWVINSIEKQQRKQNNNNNLFNEESIYFLNEKKKLKIVKANRNSVIFNEDTVEIKTRDLDEFYVKKLFYKYADNILLEILNNKRHQWDKMLEENNIYRYPSINVKLLKSRWGFCVPTKNKITLNTALIHYQIECIDYVLLHEYAHLIQPNHSKKFYDILSKYMPNYKEYVSILKNGYDI